MSEEMIQSVRYDGADRQTVDVPEPFTRFVERNNLRGLFALAALLIVSVGGYALAYLTLVWLS